MRLQPLATALGIFVLCVLAVAYAVRTPRPVAADAPPGTFSAERAMTHVRELARAPRPTGSEGHERALIYIMSRIAALGLEPFIQATTGVGTRYPVAGRVRNIVARIPGTFPSTGASAVLLVAHWDGVVAGPAAGDDASGVAVLLETLRAIRSGPLPGRDVIALFTDSEESGLLGASAFAREHAWANDVAVIMNFEARGTHGPSLMFETGAANYEIVSFLREVRGVRATSLSTAVYRQLPNDTDLSELAILDRPALNFAFIGGVERYHTAEDDVEHLSAGSLQHHGNQALELARFFAGVQISRHSPQGDAVFFDLPIAGLVVYPESWAVPLSVFTLAVCVTALVFAARRRGRDYLVASLGALALLLSVVIAAFAAAGVAALLERLHASLPWGGTPQWRGIYAAAIAALAIAIVAVAVAVARRGATENIRALDAGALVAFALMGLFVTAALPGASFLFTWPVLAAGAAALAAAMAPRPFATAARWLATAVIIFVLAPTIYLMVCVALGLDVAGAGVLAVLAALGCWLLLPHLWEISSRPWRAPAAAAAAALGLIVIGIFTVRTNAAQPAGTAFVYASDSAANGAWLTGSATNAWSRAWVAGELRSRASLPAAVPPAWLTRTFSSRRIVAAPMVPLPAPVATIVKDSASPDARVVTLRIRAAGARSVQVSAEGEVLSARVDDRDIRTDRYRAPPSPWRLEYVAPSDSGFTITLALRPGAHAVSLVARRVGLPPGIPVPARPPGIIPVGSGDATHIYRRIALPTPSSGLATSGLTRKLRGKGEETQENH
jgi:Peptidase family M28